MNQFRLVEKKEPVRYERLKTADIFIDGTRLIDRLQWFEAPFAEKDGRLRLAGRYSSLHIVDSFYPSRHFLGEPGPLYDRKGKCTLLICDCTTPHCWDFICRITVLEKTILWSCFEQPHSKWDYSGLGEFEFDRGQYENELRFPPRGAEAAFEK